MPRNYVKKNNKVKPKNTNNRNLTSKGNERKQKFTDLQLQHFKELDEARKSGFITNNLEKLKLENKLLAEHERRIQNRYERLTVEGGIKFLCDIFDFFINNPSVYHLKEFYLMSDYDTCFSYFRLDQYRKKFSVCEDLYNYIIELQEARLVKAALEGKINPGSANMVLTNLHRWVNRSEQEIIVSQKEYVFNFDGVKDQNVIDVESTDITDIEPEDETN